MLMMTFCLHLKNPKKNKCTQNKFDLEKLKNSETNILQTKLVLRTPYPERNHYLLYRILSLEFILVLGPYRDVVSVHTYAGVQWGRLPDSVNIEEEEEWR